MFSTAGVILASSLNQFVQIKGVTDEAMRLSSHRPPLGVPEVRRRGGGWVQHPGDPFLNSQRSSCGGVTLTTSRPPPQVSPVSGTSDGDGGGSDCFLILRTYS